MKIFNGKTFKEVKFSPEITGDDTVHFIGCELDSVTIDNMHTYISGGHMNNSTVKGGTISINNARLEHNHFDGVKF